MKKRLSPKKVEEAINRSYSVNSDSEKTLTISSEVRYLYEASRKSVKFHFVQAKKAHKDIVEQKACLIYRHDFNLVIILDTIVDVDQRYGCSGDQTRQENE